MQHVMRPQAHQAERHCRSEACNKVLKSSPFILHVPDQVGQAAQAGVLFASQKPFF